MSPARPVCVITGTTSGIGAVTARELARAGYQVLMAVRDPVRGAAVAQAIHAGTGNAAVQALPCDLGDYASVRACAATIRATHPAVHLLVNNAGVFTMHRHETAAGHEQMFAVNHLGHYLLARLLQDRLAPHADGAPARVVVVGSQSHSGRELDFDDLMQRQFFRGLRAYGASKLANVMFALALARRMAGQPITVNCLDPGVVGTSILPRDHAGMRLVAPLARRLMGDVERGARTTLHVALDPALATVSGAWFDARQRIARPSRAALDVAAQERLWAASAALVGLAVD